MNMPNFSVMKYGNSLGSTIASATLQSSSVEVDFEGSAVAVGLVEIDAVFDIGGERGYIVQQEIRVVSEDEPVRDALPLRWRWCRRRRWRRKWHKKRWFRGRIEAFSAK